MDNSTLHNIELLKHLLIILGPQCLLQRREIIGLALKSLEKIIDGVLCQINGYYDDTYHFAIALQYRNNLIFCFDNLWLRDLLLDLGLEVRELQVTRRSALHVEGYGRRRRVKSICVYFDE